MSLFSHRLYVIAEVANAAQGVVEDNHRIIDAVADTGADAIKFQLYKYDELATPSYVKFKIFKDTFYSLEDRTQFIQHACDVNLDVWVDIFDRWGLDVAQRNLNNITAVKIPPTVILDDELFKQTLNLNLPTAIGVGGYEDEDIHFVLSKLEEFKNPILLIYGFQAFPTPEEETSLSRITYLKQKYGYAMGFADHVSADSEMSFRMPEYALYTGASVIEKHVTLNRAAKGLDYFSSLEPHEFGLMVDNLKRCAGIYGSQQITSAQKDYLTHATRITATQPAETGDVIFDRNIKFRRTDALNALFPSQVAEYFPAVAIRNIKKDAGIKSADIRKALAGVVVVCRLDSKRLPRKALADLNGVPAIKRCLLNTLASQRSAMTILATSEQPEDEELKKHTLGGDVNFFQGSGNDPAQRMLDAADQYGLDFIVRVTGDSPLVSYELIDLLLDSHFRTGADFSYLHEAPLGAKAEVITKQAIKRLKSMKNTDGYSEYLTLYFKNNPQIFKLNEVTAPEIYRYPNYRLNLDYPEDHKLLQQVFEHLDVGPQALPLLSVLEFLKMNPDIANINASIIPKYVADIELAEHLNEATKIDK